MDLSNKDFRDEWHQEAGIRIPHWLCSMFQKEDCVIDRLLRFIPAIRDVYCCQPKVTAW